MEEPISSDEVDIPLKESLLSMPGNKQDSNQNQNKINIDSKKLFSLSIGDLKQNPASSLI